MGLKLTEERLRLINQYKHASFEVFDLKDQCGNANRHKGQGDRCERLTGDPPENRTYKIPSFRRAYLNFPYNF